MKTATTSRRSLTRKAALPLLGSIATLLATSHAQAASSTWKTDAGYYNYWNTASNWVGTTIADGADSTADFSNITLGTNRTLTLDGSHTIGNLKFGDLGNSYDWTVTNSNSAVLTLNTTTGTAPTITVTNRTTSIGLALAGNDGLTKEGAGNLTLTGANTYTGTTTINAGTFTVTGSLNDSSAVTVNGGTYALGANDTVGAVSLKAGTISGNYTLTASSYSLEAGTVSAKLAGTSGLTKSTAGTVTLSGANTYTGTTRVTAGTLALGNINALGNSTLDLNAADTGLVTFTASGTNTYFIYGLTGSRDLAFGANTISVGNSNASTTYSGVLSGSGGLNKNGNGTLTLSGTNTYTGVTNVGSGTLNVTGQLADTSAVKVNGSSSIYTVGADDTVGDVTVQSSGSINGTGILTPSSVNIGNGSISVSLSGTGSLTQNTSGATGTLSGHNTYTGGTFISNGTISLGHATDTLADTGAVTVSGGSLSLGANSDTVGAVTLTAGSITSTTGVLTGSSYDVRSGSISAKLAGSGALTKSTTSTVTLTGVNTYTGGTSVNSGTLALGNATNALVDTGAVTVNGGELALTTNSDTVGAVTLTSGTISSTTGTLTGSSYAVQSGLVSAKLAGSGIALNKTGAGIVILSGSNAYSGSTTISEGTLQIGNSGTAGALSTSSVIVNNGSLIFNRTNAVTQGTDFSGAGITGNGSLTQAGSGVLTLNTINSYSGGTTVNAGTLVLGHASNTLADTGSVTVSGGVLDLGSNSDVVGAVALSSGSITGSGTLFASSYALDAGTVSANLAASGAGTGAVTKSGSGTLTLSGANTFGGGVNLKSGTLNINNASALGDGTFAIGDTTGSTAVTINNTSGAPVNISVNNNTQSWNQNFVFSGSNALNLGSGNVALTGNRSITVNTNTLTVGGSISDNASGYSLTKLGTSGTLALSGSSTYSGGTTISAGKIVANHSNALGSGTVGISAGSGNQLILGNGVNVGNALTINGGGSSGQGVLYLASGTATYSGAVNITASPYSGGHFAAAAGSVLNLTGPINSSVQVRQYGGTVVYSGGGSYTSLYQTDATNLITQLGANNGLATNANVTVGSSSGQGLDLAGFNQSLAGLTASATSSKIGNSSTTSDSTLTLTGSSTYAGVIADSFNGTGSKKTNVTIDGGTLTLKAVGSTYTGATTVNSGTLSLNFTASTTVDSNLIGTSSALTLNNATVELVGKASKTNSQTFAGTTFNSGASQLRLTGSTSNVVALNLGALTRTAGATVNFIQPAGTIGATNGYTTTTANDASGILGTWATVGGTDWAANNGTNIIAYTGYVNDTWASGKNTTVTADNGTPASDSTTNSLRFNTAAAQTVNLSGTNTVQSGGILVTPTVGNRASTITGGTLQGAYNGELLVIQNNTANATGLQINSVIADNGVSGLTKSGSGTLTLGAANTYTGATRAVSGTLALGNVSALAGSTLDLNAADAGTVAFGVAGSNTYNIGSLTGSRGLALGGNTVSVGANNASSTYSGSINGTGGLTKVGSGTQTLSAANSYTGATTVNGGKLLVSGSGSINASSGATVSGNTASLRYDSSVGLTRNVSVDIGGTFAYNSASNYTGTLALTNGKLGGTNWNGTLGGLTISAGQTISPGNSPGTASTTLQAWASLGSYDWEINKATGAAGADPGWDLLSLSGGLNITATSGSKFTINVISLTLANTAGNADSFDASANYSWLIADAATSITSFSADKFAVNTSGFSNSNTGSFSVVRGDSVAGGDDSQIYLTYAAVPEPSTWALLVGGIGMLGFVQGLRRRTLHG